MSGLEAGAGAGGGLISGAVSAILQLPRLLGDFDKPTSDEVYRARQYAYRAFTAGEGAVNPRGAFTSGNQYRVAVSRAEGPSVVGAELAPFRSAGALASPFFRALPGTRGAPQTPSTPQTPREPTWRDVLEQSGVAAVQLAVRVLNYRRAQQAQRAQQRALRALIDRLLARLPAGGITGAPAPGATRMDLLQLSAGGTGGLSSLFGGTSEFGGGLDWTRLLLGAGDIAVRALTGQQESDLARYGDPWGPNILYPQSERAGAALTSALAGGCGSPFVAGQSALRASTFAMANPASGKLTWFKPAGRPVLWSGDFGACRRVARVARKARRRVGGR